MITFEDWCESISKSIALIWTGLPSKESEWQILPSSAKYCMWLEANKRKRERERERERKREREKEGEKEREKERERVRERERERERKRER